MSDNAQAVGPSMGAVGTQAMGAAISGAASTLMSTTLWNGAGAGGGAGTDEADIYRCLEGMGGGDREALKSCYGDMYLEGGMMDGEEDTAAVIEQVMNGEEESGRSWFDDVFGDEELGAEEEEDEDSSWLEDLGGGVLDFMTGGLSSLFGDDEDSEGESEGDDGGSWLDGLFGSDEESDGDGGGFLFGDLGSNVMELMGGGTRLVDLVSPALTSLGDLDLGIQAAPVADALPFHDLF